MEQASENLFPQMAAIVLPAAKGRACVEHITVNTAGGATACYVYGEFKNPSPAGTYVRLRVTDDAGQSPIMMSDFLYERVTCEEVVLRAHGDVLIAGLGLGMILHPILKKQEVRSLTVVEKYQDVVDLILPTLPSDPRLTVITEDIFHWQPPADRLYDVIWFDIWPDIEASRLSEMAELHRRFRPHCNHSNPRAWMESWHRRETTEGLRRQDSRQSGSQIAAGDESQSLEAQFGPTAVP